MAQDPEITPEHLVMLGSMVTVPKAPAAEPAAARSLAEIEREAIEHALARCDGNRRRAAEQLGIGVRTLYDKLKRYELR